MKKPTYTLSIPQPCHERWDTMTPSEKGRFCASCQKQVVDFSGLSDREVIQLIEQTSESICGQLHPSQMNRPMVFEPWAQRASARFSGFFAGLMLLSSADTVSSQNISNEVETASVQDVSGTTLADVSNKVQQDTLKNAIHGRVIDAKTMAPIVNADIWIKQDSRIRTKSDSQGAFILKIPGERLEKTSRLTVQVNGYLQYELRVKGSDIINGLSLDLLLDKMPAPIDTDGERGRIHVERKGELKVIKE